MKILTILLLLSIINVKGQEYILISETDSLKLYDTYLSTNTTENIFPTIYNNGLIYRSIHKTSFYHLLYSDLKSKSKKIKINKKFQLGAVSVFENEIYVTARSKHVDSYGISNLIIYKGYIENLKVINLKALPICNKNFTYADPAISKDGNLMVVITNENGSYHLLEFIRNKNNEWERGEVIFISHPNFKIFNPTFYDKNTIYFSSNIYNGKLESLKYENVEGKLELVEENREKGVFNIYKVQRKNGKWQLPAKAKALNSEFDELGVVFNTGTSGYITSFRFNNTDNIYYFELK